MSATWVDATRVGVPSDFYYLAANGPLLSRLTTSANCRDVRVTCISTVVRPSIWTATPRGTSWRRERACASGGARATRFAYFVAAPGFGPVHRVGIPSSGLYVVVAVVNQRRGAKNLLEELMRRTRFGDDAIQDFVAMAPPAQSA